jgi:excisionase family DNA binding protein
MSEAFKLINLPEVAAVTDPIKVDATASEYLKVKDVSSLLGVSPATIYRLTEARKLPYLKVGGQIRFRKQSIDAWARQREKGPLSA